MTRPKPLFSQIVESVLLPVLLVAGLALWSLIASVPLGIFLLLQRLPAWTSGHPWRQAACTLLFGLVGYALFQFRSRQRLLYGALEIIVAIIGIWYALGTTASLRGSAAAIIASLYVLVRGIDNYKTGISDQHRRMGLDDAHRPLPKADGILVSGDRTLEPVKEPHNTALHRTAAAAR